MRVLIHHVGTPSPIFETELEIIKSHQELGDVVRVLQCDGALPNCQWNHEQMRAKCAVCRSRFTTGLSLLMPKGGIELVKIRPLSAGMNFSFPSVFNSVEDIKNYQYDGEALGYGAASSLISKLRDHRFDTRKFHDEIIRELKTSVGAYAEFKAEMQSFRPDLVYIFNGRIATHLPAKLLCERMGVDYYCYETAFKENSYKLVKNKAIHYIIPKNEVEAIDNSWDAEHESLGNSYFQNKRGGGSFGKVPIYTGQQGRGELPQGFDPGKKNIAIFNGTIDEYAAVQGWEGRIYEPDETEGVRKILQSFESDDQYRFYLRVHPHMRGLPKTTSQLDDIYKLSIQFRNLVVIWPEQTVDSYALMESCSKVVTFGSTIGAEATYWGKPSILAGKAYYEEFGCAYLPGTHEEVVDLLERDIPPLPRSTAVRYGFWELTAGVHYKYFKETGVRDGLAVGAFDGVHIRASRIPRWWYATSLFALRAMRVIRNPLLLLKLKRYLSLK